MENKQIYPPRIEGMYDQKGPGALSGRIFSIDVSLDKESVCAFFSKYEVCGSLSLREHANQMFGKRSNSQTSAENLEKVTFRTNQDAIYPVSSTINQARGFVGLRTLSESKGVQGDSAYMISNGDQMISCTAFSLEQVADIKEPDMVHYKHVDALPYEQLRDLKNYAKQVEPAQTGAMTHPGGKEEVVCYADI